MQKHTAKITSKSIEQSGLPTDYRKAIAEYIWNGFDANASRIDINFDANEVGFINHLSIVDNGTGIDISTLDDTFGNFLDSQKEQSFSATGFVKGKKGKGRYSFTNFCHKAIWNTTFNNANKLLNFTISIEKSDSVNYAVSNEKTIKKGQNTGTIVSFEKFFNLTGDLLESDDFQQFIAQEFGWFLYLNKDKGYKLVLNGGEINYQSIIADTDSFDLQIGKNNFKITYIRWSKKIGDKYFYYFLNSKQLEIGRKHTSFNNKAIEFHHSLYVESLYFDDFEETKENEPTLGFFQNQADDTYKALISHLNVFLKEKEKYFIKENKADELIKRYNKDRVFPKFKSNAYERLRKQDLENVVKEIYCAEPKIFLKLNKEQSKTLVGFLNLLLDSEERENILTILESVTKLDEEEREELAKALKNTELKHIVSLVRFLENRFKVINSLKALVFDLEKYTNEREHIQKVIESNYWLFGEQYHLISADDNFEILLHNYLHFVEAENKKPNISSLNKKNKLKRPDIFICRQNFYPDPLTESDIIEENIIVELKRPSVIIGIDQFRQIENYMRFIVEEEQFNSQHRKWKFLLVGKKVDDYIKDQYDNQKNKGKKFLVQSIRNYEFYAMTWDDVFTDYRLKNKHMVDKLKFKDTVLEELKDAGVSLDKEASDLLTYRTQSN
ncbi:ATP-binding protein [Sinomicrobium pectinilyticum]|uniref:ATP-binding protein n=1 Tax=Sinomicrobium pectinilyticum TaxID=1084421 RepID=A0A3N0F5A3_SINP1|nr:ATP-binding protein [Sinomicrobium pectinilyticum]RNL95179.1 ATP-binding protein [Sinomicrobium pectinilyticum]